MRKLLIGLFLSCAGLACAGVAIEKDIPYLGEDRAEKMDAYLPPEEFPRPVPAIVMIHGGGWKGGDKAQSSGTGYLLAGAGYAVFAINYKLNAGYRDENNKLVITELAWPQNFQDCKTAVRFVRREVQKFGVDPKHIGVMGASAGGHLAMLVGTTAADAEWNSQGLYQEESNEISCVIDLYGVPDLRGRKLTPFTGSAQGDRGASEAKASPVTYLGAKTPPFFIAHGTADATIPVEESRKLVELLKQQGIGHVYVEIPDAPHSFGLKSPQKDLMPELLEFLKKYLGESQVR